MYYQKTSTAPSSSSYQNAFFPFTFYCAEAHFWFSVASDRSLFKPGAEDCVKASCLFKGIENWPPVALRA